MLCWSRRLYDDVERRKMDDLERREEGRIRGFDKKTKLDESGTPSRHPLEAPSRNFFAASLAAAQTALKSLADNRNKSTVLVRNEEAKLDMYLE